MPIYAYKCESCGYAKDVLQKMSDAPLSDCPECGVVSFKKQLTAAGFQLKGSGWYVTDFRGGDSAAKASKPADGEAAATAPASTVARAADAGAASTPSTAPAASVTSAVVATPAASKGASSESSSRTT